MQQNTEATASARRETTPAPAEAADRARTRRKVMAVLAGGLVLGVGAAITLAAWNDSEFATGNFAAGTFDLEGSTDGTTFSDHASAPGASLTFQVAADRLTPDATVYHLYSIKLGSNSNYGADVAVTSAGTGTIAPNVSYSITDIGAATTCDAAAVAAGTNVVPADTTATLATADPVGSLAALADQLNLCIAVTAESSIEQAQTGSITWEFTGTSTDAIS